MYIKPNVIVSRVDRFWENAAQSPLQIVQLPLFIEREVSVYIKRDDLLHPFVSGNKWRKLKYNLLEAEKLGLKRLVTFGGAYSNHIAAVAAAGQAMGFETLGIIRGDELYADSNQTLQFASHCGMKLQFVTRAAYRNKESLISQFGENSYILPEGGSNQLAMKGVGEALEEIQTQLSVPIDYLCTAFGTGGTSAGLLSAAALSKVLVFSSLKIKKSDIETHLGAFVPLQDKKLDIFTDYHFGGYGKETEELNQFIDDFEQKTTVPLEQVYTGKMMYGVVDLVQKGYFNPGDVVVVLHSGGLQGKRK